MPMLYNIYCDESCHLEKDKQKAMVIGGVCCTKSDVRRINVSIRDLKRKHGMNPNKECKWVKISPNKIDFYLEMIDLFFKEESLTFRAVVVPDKSKLRHKDFGQDHNTFYDKIYYLMLSAIIDTNNKYRIFVDIKDDDSASKCKTLHEYLCNTYHDWDKDSIERIQVVRSDEIEIMQLADILIGALSYIHRGLTSSNAKLQVIERIRQASGLSLLNSTSLHSKKINILKWNAS